MSIDLAVWHDGMPVHPDDHEVEALRGKPSEGRWVIAINTTNEEFLLASPADGGFYWQGIGTCIVFRMKTPDVPGLVMPVQPGTPNQQNGLVVPEMNRMMRRNGNN